MKLPGTSDVGAVIVNEASPNVLFTAENALSTGVALPKLNAAVLEALKLVEPLSVL